MGDSEATKRGWLRQGVGAWLPAVGVSERRASRNDDSVPAPYQLNDAETRWVVSRLVSLGKSLSSAAKNRLSSAA